jgi:hypothetical protein
MSDTAPATADASQPEPPSKNALKKAQKDKEKVQPVQAHVPLSCY